MTTNDIGNRIDAVIERVVREMLTGGVARRRATTTKRARKASAGKHRLSVAGRRAISIAAKRRWAKHRAKQK